jgi:opacity protein-like surface antigen
MKKILVSIYVLAIVALYVQNAMAQGAGPEIRLHGYTSYAFDDHVESYNSNTSYFEGTIEGGLLYGGGLEFKVRPDMGVELTYLRLDSKAPMEYYYDGIRYEEFDLASNYIMIGGNSYIPGNSRVEPYGGIQIGMAIFNIESSDFGISESATKFAWGVKLGANIWATETVGIKLQGGLISAVQAAGGSVYFGTGGAGAGISGYSTFYQFSLGGGLVFKVGGR